MVTVLRALLLVVKLDIMIPAESKLTAHILSAHKKIRSAKGTRTFSSSGKSKVSTSSSQIDCFLYEGQSTCMEVEKQFLLCMPLNDYEKLIAKFTHFTKIQRNSSENLLLN